MASKANTSVTQVPLFTGDVYEFWSIKMKTLFSYLDLWEIVEKGIPARPDGEAYMKAKKGRYQERFKGHDVHTTRSR